MKTLVETPDPEPLPWGVNATSVTAYPAIPNTSSAATVSPVSVTAPGVPWLRLDRKNTVPLTSAASGRTNLIFPINPEGTPA